jgi:hypothetical protein
MLTNRHGLPVPLVNAILNDPYTNSGSDITVTGLIQPPQIRYLMQGRDVTEDATDCIWRLLGSAVHAILERAYPDTAIVEQRMFTRVNGWVVSGQFDVYDSGRLTDYKITSVYSRGGKLAWEQQLNLLAALCRRNDMPVTDVEIVAIFRDWRQMEVFGAYDYPEAQVAVIPVSLWSADEAEAYLIERVRLHQQAVPPPCTDEERWRQVSKVALMQKGKKRAIKLYDAQPEGFVLSKGQYWEDRPGAYRRCESYCPASKHCEQWNETRRREQDRVTEPEDVADAAGHIEASPVAG